MATKTTLTLEQQELADTVDEHIVNLGKLRERLKNYSLGSCFIRQYKNFSLATNKQELMTEKSNLGFPVKYKVVYVSPQGVPYLRRLTANGHPMGDAFLPPEALVLRELSYVARGEKSARGREPTEVFTPDPDQLDAILLQQEFDPTEKQREKTKLFNEVKKHNKGITVPTGYDQYHAIANFFKSKQPGDKFWTSPDKQFVIQSVSKTPKEYIVRCTDHNQKTVTFRFKDFVYKRLYSAQPRSFARETSDGL